MYMYSANTFYLVKNLRVVSYYIAICGQKIYVYTQNNVALMGLSIYVSSLSRNSTVLYFRHFRGILSGIYFVPVSKSFPFSLQFTVVFTHVMKAFWDISIYSAANRAHSVVLYNTLCISESIERISI